MGDGSNVGESGMSGFVFQSGKSGRTGDQNKDHYCADQSGSQFWVTVYRLANVLP